MGGSVRSITLENALAYAYEKGITIVCASGNDGSENTVSYPAAYDAYCIAVGATRYDETIAYYSNHGASLDLVAPGGDLNVDQNEDGYADGILQQTFGENPTDWGYWFYQGTSMAAPHVSGVVALLIAYNVAISPDEIREVLQSTAEDKGAPGWDPVYGWGIVDALAALNFAYVPNDPPVADANGPYTGEEDSGLIFDGSGSIDPNGDPLTYMWNFGDGSTGAGVRPTHAYTAGGEYPVTLVVNDGTINSTPSITTAIIAEVNDPPVADAGLDQIASLNKAVTFNGSGSYDIDDGIVAYDWNFGDQTTGFGVTATHTYSVPGVYTITLTVTDNGGLNDTDTAIATITEELAFVMEAGIDMDLLIRRIGRNTFIKAIARVTIVDGEGSFIGGATVSGTWSDATSETDSRITDSKGSVLIRSNWVKNVTAGTTFTFTVDDVVKSGWTYISGNISESIAVP